MNLNKKIPLAELLLIKEQLVVDLAQVDQLIDERRHEVEAEKKRLQAQLAALEALG